MISAPSALPPSSQRPIPLSVRNDLRFERIEYKGIGYWVVKDPVGLKYYRLRPEQYNVLRNLDGERHIEQLRDLLLKEMPTVQLQLTDIQQLVTDLHKKGLVYSNRSGQGATLIKKHREERKKKLFATARNMLYLRLPGWDPERSLQFLYPFVSWIFQPWAVVLTWTFVIASWILLGIQFNTFRSQLPEFQQFFGWPNLIYMWGTLAVAKILHEFGHGLSCKHFGGECHEMGLMFLVFSPTLYCDVSDSWMLKSKWKRIIIGGAGMYVEVILSAIAVFAWWYTESGLIHNLCLNIFFVTTATTVIFNANPLMRFDGYYMMSDLLEIPNLRPKSDRLLRESFAWYCLGIESKPDPFMPETGKFWFVIYAISAALYRWFVIFGIAFFLYAALKPWGLQSIGITLAVVSISTIIFNLLFNVYKTISAPRIDPMSKPKMAISAVVFAGLVWGILAIPIPWHLEAAFVIEPHDVRHVYVTTPGELEDLQVATGQDVQSGQMLAQLTNYEMEDQRRQRVTERDAQEIKIKVYDSLDDSGQRELAREQWNSINQHVSELDKQLENLKIKAPIAGTVVPPPRKPRPKLDDSESEMPVWFGTPLDDRNSNCYLEPRTHLLSIAPDEKFQAIILVDQADRNEMDVGQLVELKFDHMVDRTYEGMVEQISDRDLEFAPEALSNKMGGELPTVTDSQGRERLESKAYQATVLLEQDPTFLKSGMRGQARFLVANRSLGEWLSRYFWQTFRFRL